MECLFLLNTQIFKCIQNIIENIRNIPVKEWITELQYIIIENNQVEEISFNMDMDIITYNTFSCLGSVIQQ